MELVLLKWSSLDFLITWVVILNGGTSLLMHDMNYIFLFVDDVLICFVNLIFKHEKKGKGIQEKKLSHFLLAFTPHF